jgi:hypothetical protein
MEIRIRGPIVYWRGPAPFHFVEIPARHSAKIKEVAALLTYGWGVVPVSVSIGATTFTTSLFPRNGIYLVPIKNAVRAAESLELGQDVTLTVAFEPQPRPRGRQSEEARGRPD